MTGLLIRDFEKRYREVRYETEGSIRLSEIEHNAYLNRLTLEVTHFNAYRAISFKTNPDSTHWGYLTSFKGTAVSENIPIKFARQRVFERINQGIWNYHQATEYVRLTKAFAESGANSILQSELLEGVQTKAVDFYLRLIANLPEQIEEDLQWILSFTYRPDPPDSTENQDYTAFPLASPFPDVWKFKADVPVSFIFRLESWYLVNPAVYILSNPSDTSDETEDEDEYPSPTPTPEGSPNNQFPPSSEPDPNSDPRDFTDEEVGNPNAPGVTAVRVFCVAYPDPNGSTETVSYNFIIFNVEGKAVPSDVTITCLQTYGSGHPLAGKCFETQVSCFGESASFITAVESVSATTEYFPLAVP